MKKNLHGQTSQFLSFLIKITSFVTNSFCIFMFSMRQVKKEEYIYPLASSCITLTVVINSGFCEPLCGQATEGKPPDHTLQKGHIEPSFILVIL